MPSTSPRTGYARLGPLQARTVLAVLVLAAVFCVGVTLSPLASGYVGKERPGAGDMALYRAKLDRMNAGEGYYRAAGHEMRDRGYPTRSVFNWRFPLPFWLLGHLPSVDLGRGALILLALAVLLMAFEVIAREEDNRIGRAAACALLLTGPLMLSILGDLFVMPSLWAGLLIALSICAYGIDRPRLGVAAGLAAVFWRELAMPYCLVAAVLAWRNKRRGELTAWVVGLGFFFICYALHCLHVSQLILPTDRAHAHGWIQFGGAPFVIATTQVNAYLLLLPQWVAALYFVAAMFGFAGWNTPLGRRAGLTACLFVMAFAVVGQDINQYWGSLLSPILCLGIVRFPASIRDVAKAASGETRPLIIFQRED